MYLIYKINDFKTIIISGFGVIGTETLYQIVKRNKKKLKYFNFRKRFFYFQEGLRIVN